LRRRELKEPRDQSGARARLTKGGKIEVDCDGVALGRRDLDGDIVRTKCFCGKLKLESGADQRAAAFLGATKVGNPRRTGWRELLVFVENLNLKVLPKIIGAQSVTDGNAGPGAGRARNHRAISWSKLNFHKDSDNLRLAAMIELGLLGAVVHRALAGQLGEESKRRQESDRRNVGARVGRREESYVFAEKVSEVLVIALAEEIGFANGFGGKGSIHGED
jgi:hypothetical protein